MFALVISKETRDINGQEEEVWQKFHFCVMFQWYLKSLNLYLVMVERSRIIQKKEFEEKPKGVRRINSLFESSVLFFHKKSGFDKRYKLGALVSARRCIIIAVN